MPGLPEKSQDLTYTGKIEPGFLIPDCYTGLRKLTSIMAGRGEELLLLASSGLTDKEIAEKLCISVRTVEGHWRRLREQSGLPNRAGLIAQMLRQQHDGNRQELLDKARQLESDVQALHDRNQALQAHQDRIAESAKHQSATLQAEINQLYQEVSRLKSQTHTQDELNAIVLKGNVLAFRVSAVSPYTCLFMSDSVRTLGYRPTDFTEGHLPITSLFHPEDFAEAWTNALEQIQTGTHRLERKYRVITKRGESRLVLDRCIFEEATESEPAALSIFAFDITHTQYAEILGQHPNLV